MLHGKPLYPAANSENVHGLRIAEQPGVTASVGVKPEAFQPGWPDLYGLSSGNHPQDISLHTAPQANVRGATHDTTPRCPICARV